MKLFALTACAAATGALAATYTEEGSFELSNPGFVEIFDGSLFITSFTGNPMGKGSVSKVDNLSPACSATVPQTLVSGLAWPNKVSLVPAEAGLGDMLAIPDGFLVPGKSTGAIYVAPLDGNGEEVDPIKISTDKSSYFYHMVEWRDMNDDGRLDCLTARATKPMIGKAKGELLWLEQPESDPLSGDAWEEHVVTEGPDVMFSTRDRDDGGFDLFAAQFFTESLTYYQIADGAVQNTTVLDDSIGAAYNAQLVDVNADGVDDLLVNNHIGNDGGAIYAYDGVFGDRHMLADGFKVTEGGSNQAAPGFVYPFSSSKSSQPYMLVAGDGSQSSYLMTPSGDFSFDIEVIKNYDGVVGSIALTPNNDAFFVPDYDHNTVYGYSLQA